MAKRKFNFEYDVCLSFAGEDRRYVERVADQLRNNGTRVFYDKYEVVELWGKDLYNHLADIYENAARYCVMFVSRHYAKKLWTNHERQNAQARAFRENEEYILPAKFDDTSVPGVRDTVGFIDLRKTKPRKLAALIAAKIGPRQKTAYFPPIPDRLFKFLGIKSRENPIKAHVEAKARNFFDSLEQMSDDERLAVYHAMLGCPAELPHNMHINIDLLRRETGFTVAKLKRILGGLRSLGVTCELRKQSHGKAIGESIMAYIKWADLNGGMPFRWESTECDSDILIAAETVRAAAYGYCRTCGEAAFKRLDFSQLCIATTEIDEH